MSNKKVLVINLLLEEYQENKIANVYTMEEKKLILENIKKFDEYMLNYDEFNDMYVSYTDINKEEVENEILSHFENYTEPYVKKVCKKIIKGFELHLKKKEKVSKEFSSNIDPVTQIISETESRLFPIDSDLKVPNEIKERSNGTVENDVKKELPKLILVNIDSESFTVKLDIDNLIVKSYLLEEDSGLIKSNLLSFISYLKNIKDENDYIYVAVTTEIPDTSDEINAWDKAFEIITDDAICTTEVRKLFYNFRKSLEKDMMKNIDLNKGFRMNLEKVDYKIFEDMLVNIGGMNKNSITYKELDSLYKKSQLFSFDVLSSITDYVKSDKESYDTEFTLLNILDKLKLNEYFKGYCIDKKTRFNNVHSTDSSKLSFIPTPPTEAINNINNDLRVRVPDEIKKVKVLFLNLTNHYIDVRTTGTERMFLPVDIALIKYIDKLSTNEVLMQTVIETIKNKHGIIIIPVLKDCDVTNAYMLYKNVVIESLSKRDVERMVYIDITTIVDNFTKVSSTNSLNKDKINTDEQYTKITIIDYDDDYIVETKEYNLTKTHSLSGVLKMDFIEVQKHNGTIVLLAYKFSTNNITEKLYTIRHNITTNTYVLLPFDLAIRIVKRTLNIKTSDSQNVVTRQLSLQDVDALRTRIKELSVYNEKWLKVKGFNNVDGQMYGQPIIPPYDHRQVFPEINQNQFINQNQTYPSNFQR